MTSFAPADYERAIGALYLEKMMAESAPEPDAALENENRQLRSLLQEVNGKLAAAETEVADRRMSSSGLIRELAEVAKQADAIRPRLTSAIKNFEANPEKSAAALSMALELLDLLRAELKSYGEKPANG